jgi:hypothetical protein
MELIIAIWIVLAIVVSWAANARGRELVLLATLCDRRVAADCGNFPAGVTEQPR